MGKLLVANWKENPRSEAHALKLFREIAAVKRGKGVVEVVVCPPFIYLDEIAAAYKRLRTKRGLFLGAQDVFWEEHGAYTSQVGPQMLRGLGVQCVIVGHSERRKFMHETDAMVNKKITRAVRDGMKVILCVGESHAVRRKGTTAAKSFVTKQIKNGLKKIALKKGQLLVAYEPIWAIGSGKSDGPDDAREMALHIKKLITNDHGFSPQFLYGGSVNRRNVADYVQLKEVDGALVGGASLRAAEFGQMIRKVASAQQNKR